MLTKIRKYISDHYMEKSKEMVARGTMECMEKSMKYFKVAVAMMDRDSKVNAFDEIWKAVAQR